VETEALPANWRVGGRKENDMKELSKMQSHAATLEAPQIMVIAGPGSGKTHTTVSRIIGMIQKGARADRMVVITFTTAAALEIRRRIKETSLVGDEHQIGYVGTLHGWCLRIIQKRYCESLVVIGEDDATALLKEKAALMKYRGSFENLMEMKTGRKRIPSPTCTEALVLKAYRRELRTGQLIDFDSILEQALAILVNAPHEAECDYLFVDEYQDSGAMDAKIYAEVRAKKFFVGDPDQAIYGFRGGSIEAIMAAAASPAWIQIYLTDNYRSVPPICTAASDLIKFNDVRMGKRTIPTRNDDGQIAAGTFESDADEMRWLVSQLMKHHEAFTLDDCAVLCRTNMMAQKISATLGSMGLHTRAKRDVLPEDWHLARAMALFYMRPEDDRLAWNYITLRDGRPQADNQKLIAASKGTTINGWLIGAKPTTGRDLVDTLRGQNITSDSLALIAEAVAVGGSHAEISAALLAVARQEREEGSGVTVTTIHGSKGREWGTVFLPGWDQEMFPGKKEGMALEEERRLAFVAITRGKNNVGISTCRKRQHPYTGRMMECRPSQFIAEAGL
jgi:DNA helicase-2/ATP-dependent DNA helicase PcrA